MRTASDVADWWDAERRKTSSLLDEFIEDNPNWFGVIVAASADTALDLGAGMVDVLRLGEGAAKGGWGWGTDALRIVGLAGPLGKGAKLMRNAGASRMARLIADPGGPRCAWVAATRALRQTGHRTGGKAFAAVDDLANAVGVPFKATKGIHIKQTIANLRQIGANVGQFKEVSSLRMATRHLPRDGSVVLIRVRGMAAGKKVGYHSVYAFYDTLGRLRIMDRGGVCASLTEVAKRYGQVDEFIPEGAVAIRNVFMKFVGPKGTATLAMEVLATTAGDPETIAQALETRGRARHGVPNDARFHRVEPGDTLSRIALKYYRDAAKWAVLFEANRLNIGDDPNKLSTGQTLWVPDLPMVQGTRKRR